MKNFNKIAFALFLALSFSTQNSFAQQAVRVNCGSYAVYVTDVPANTQPAAQYFCPKCTASCSVPWGEVMGPDGQPKFPSKPKAK